MEVEVLLWFMGVMVLGNGMVLGNRGSPSILACGSAAEWRALHNGMVLGNQIYGEGWHQFQL